jgi:predicted RNA-binding Zn-ribbon protein involved in translation (DUF1610 family)
MEEDRHVKAKREAGAHDDRGWQPGVGQLLGVVLCLVILLAAIILGVTTGMGLIFAIPLGIAALVVGLIMFRGGSKRLTAPCPHCGAPVRFQSHIAELNCPSCHKRIEVRGGALSRVG